MINLNEEIDLLLEYSLASDGNNESLLLLVEKLAPLKARDVKSVFLALKIPWPKLKERFEEYIAQQAKSPLGSKSNEEVIEKVKRVAQIFDELWNKGTVNFDKVVKPEKESEPGTTGPGRTPSKPEGKELTPEQREKLENIQNQAIDTLAKRQILLGKEAYNNMGLLRKLGNIVKKYFISKMTLREEERTTAPQLRGTSSSQSAAGATGTGELLKQLSKTVLIDPVEAQKNLDKLMNRIKKDIIDQKFDALQDEDKKNNLEVVKSMIRRAAFSGLKENKIINEDKMVEIVIDFNELRKMELNESFLAMFGGWVEHLLKAMFGKYTPPVSIRGTQSDVRSFASALNGEKRYIEAAKRYGLDHPTTYKNRAKLDSSIKSFEKETGLTWPFK